MAPVIGKQLDERVIYQATKHVFIGKYAKIRERGVVRTSINNNLLKGNPVKQVVADHGFDAVAETVLKLLLENVYESAAIASQRFPDPEPSSVQTAASTQVQAEATTTEQVTPEGTELANSDNNRENGHTEEDIKPIQDASDGTPCDIAGIQVYLPFPTEHLLMEKLQKVLETACYEYGVRELSSIMQDRHWDCPEAVELSQWAELLGNEGNLKRQGKKKFNRKSLQSIAQIRHTAVHRLRTNSAGLERFLTDAERLAGILGGTVYAKAISHLRSDAQSALMELTQNKQFIQLQLEHAQEEIAKKRAELDQEEQEVLRCIAKEDEKYRMLAGDRLQNALELMGGSKIVTDKEGAVLDGSNGMEENIFYADDSDVDYADQFEDCDEAWFP